MDFKNYVKAIMVLDKLQVELCQDTPYETPSPEDARKRILDAMDKLEQFRQDFKIETAKTRCWDWLDSEDGYIMCRDSQIEHCAKIFGEYEIDSDDALRLAEEIVEERECFYYNCNENENE